MKKKRPNPIVISEEVEYCNWCMFKVETVSKCGKFKYDICRRESRVLPECRMEHSDGMFRWVIDIPDWCPFMEVQKDVPDPLPAARAWFEEIFKDNIVGQIFQVPEGCELNGEEHIMLSIPHPYYMETLMAFKRALGDKKFYVRVPPRVKQHFGSGGLHIFIRLYLVKEEQKWSVLSAVKHFFLKERSTHSLK